MSDDESSQPLERKRTSLLHRHSTHQNPADIYDHAIGLVDTTVTSASASGEQTPIQQAASSDDPLGRRRDRVKASMRGEYNRQKWRRYQKERLGNEEAGTDGESDDPEAVRVSKDTYGRSTLRRNYDRVRDKIPMKQKTKNKATKKEEYVIDILYENQRGVFFCGIPLYSHQSLLNFDPPAWQTKDFKDSPVNITNAQPPDPTWVWGWRTWYVDMSRDVDEEGWEYSLMFRHGFAWHGTHPWFHSFVRRRRWLRKRVKIKPRTGREHKDALHESHKLTRDYFTIHSASREPSANRVPTLGEAATSSSNNQRYSVITAQSYASDGDASDSLDDIKDVNALMKALRAATVDRKKLAAVRAFLTNAGPEVHYLPEQIQNIMDLFIYQTSRRQVVHELQLAAATAQSARSELENSSSSTTPLTNPGALPQRQQRSRAIGTGSDGAEDQSRRPSPSPAASGTATPSQRQQQLDADDQVRSIERTIELATARVHHFEYWSDIKKIVAEGDALDVPPPPPEGPDLDPAVVRQFHGAVMDDGCGDGGSNTGFDQDGRISRIASSTGTGGESDNGTKSGSRNRDDSKDVDPSKLQRPSAPTRQKSDGVRIKGIPEAAHVGQEVGIARRVTLEMKKREQEEQQQQQQQQQNRQQQANGRTGEAQEDEEARPETVAEEVQREKDAAAARKNAEAAEDEDEDDAAPMEEIDAAPEPEPGAERDDDNNASDTTEHTSTNKGKGREKT